MQLNKVQENFRDLMLDQPEALDMPPEELAAIFETGNIALPERLKVYRNNIVNSITDALADKLPLTEKLVGREFLTLMARSFALENPPQHGCLNLYGAGFADFIAGFELAKSLPYLPDMARLELAMNAAYYAPDDAPLIPDDLAAIPPEDLGDVDLKPRASVNLVHSTFPLLQIKEFCEKDGAGQMDMSAPGEPLMVYRKELSVEIVPLQKDESAMLVALQNQTLGAALEAISADYPDFDIAAFLQKHIALETFAALGSNT